MTLPRGWRARKTAIATAIVAALVVSSADAATFTVGNTTDDPGDCSAPATCSLRQAIADANAAAGDDVIEFDLPAPSVISLANGPLGPDSADELAISGPGAESLTVRATPASPTPVFIIDGPTRLSGFTIRDGVGAPFVAGGILALADVALDRMALAANTVDASGDGSGAAIVSYGVLEIRNSLLHANRVTNADSAISAGAIVNLGFASIVSSTLTDNHVEGSETDAAGAILNVGLAIVNNTTISGNSAQNGTGGIVGDNPTYLANTILAANTGGASADCGAGVGSQGYNLIGTPVGCFFSLSTGDQVALPATINPLLLGLASNGGPTQTLALMLASPARDAGNPAAPSDAPPPPPPDLVACATTDQRGTARPAGTACDVGAYELVPPPPPPAPPPAAPPPPAAVPPPAVPPAAPAQFVAPAIDHFKCYDAAGRFRPRTVRLRDQFSSGARTVRVRRAASLCNPVSKDGSRVREPKAHLTCYGTKDLKTPARRRVIVANQFGVRRLTVLEPVSLCVPSLKRQGSVAPPTSPDPEKRLDHFRCYSVAPLRTPRTVTLKDQFGTGRSAVISVTRLCNPVSKNGGPVRRPAAHLVCYTIRDRTPSQRRRVTVRDQFGVARLRALAAHRLCLPSLKQDVGTAGSARYAAAKRRATRR